MQAAYDGAPARISALLRRSRAPVYFLLFPLHLPARLHAPYLSNCDGEGMTDASRDAILVRGARQNNLKNLDLDIPLNELDRRHRRVRLRQVVAGVRHAVRRRAAPLRRDVLAVCAAVSRPHGQAAGRSHRRHSAGHRHRPDQSGAHLALDRRHDDRAQRSSEAAVRARGAAVLPAAAASRCAATRPRASTRTSLRARASRRRSAPAAVLSGAGAAEFQGSRGARAAGKAGLHALLRATGSARDGEPASAKRRAQERVRKTLEVVQDRAARSAAAERARVLESLEAALRVGHGRVNVHVVDEARSAADASTVWRYSSELHCAECDLSYHEPTPSLFSFNSPLGACETCRGFGRTIGIDYGLVIPDESKSLRAGAIKPWQTQVLRRVPGGSREVREEARHSARHAVARARRRARASG